MISSAGDAAGNYGVAALVSPIAMKELRDHETLIQHRVLRLNFRKLTIDVVYAPALGDDKKQQDKSRYDQFYEAYKTIIL